MARKSKKYHEAKQFFFPPRLVPSFHIAEKALCYFHFLFIDTKTLKKQNEMQEKKFLLRYEFLSLMNFLEFLIILLWF